MNQFLSTTTCVEIEGLRVLAFVGHQDPEMSMVQTVLIDIRCTLDDPEVRGDELSQSADYVPITRAIRTIAKGKKRRLIETLAEECAIACFANERVRECRIRIRKPHKLPDCDSVGTIRVFKRKEE
ncbi:MAG: folB [Parcubacteria group bacterium]|nr:folB [Parcubacteria group bacterium]